MKLQSSKYNYFIDNDNTTIVFNGISEKFIELNNTHIEYYNHIFNEPDQYKSQFYNFIKKMIDEGFIIDESVNELSLILRKFEYLRKNNQYYLMILPTYQCNVRCWYCVQHHKEIWMTDDIYDRIMRRLTMKINDPTIDEVHLSWFGGEPLLAYDKIVELTTYAKTETINRLKTFRCDITTNGILLNPERIEQLRIAGVTGYQITIDGSKEYHDSVKRISDGSAFETTLRNINALSRHTHCTLRFNYTHRNLHPTEIFNDLKKRLHKDSLKNIVFMLYKVWQEGIDNINPNDVLKLRDLSMGLGLHTQLPTCGMCYSDQKHFDCIFPDGTCEKCDNESPQAAKGLLLPNGEITWNSDIKNIHTPPFLLKESECYFCKYLPLCWGPCVAKREIMIKKYNRIYCFRKNKAKEISEIVRNIARNIKSPN